MMTPMQPVVVVSLIQSGWAADAVMRMMVSWANGVNNRFGAGKLALVTRSMLEILLDLASALEAPPDDLALGIVPPAAHFDKDAAEGYQPLTRIRSGATEPDHAFVAVPYVFSFVMMIFSLMDTSAPRGQPIVTVPAS